MEHINYEPSGYKLAWTGVGTDFCLVVRDGIRTMEYELNVYANMRSGSVYTHVDKTFWFLQHKVRWGDIC